MLRPADAGLRRVTLGWDTSALWAFVAQVVHLGLGYLGPGIPRIDVRSMKPQAQLHQTLADGLGDCAGVCIDVQLVVDAADVIGNRMRA